LHGEEWERGQCELLALIKYIYLYVDFDADGRSVSAYTRSGGGTAVWQRVQEWWPW